MTRDEIYQDIKATFGLLPEFFTHLPDATLENDWNTFKSFELSETAIPLKYKELMGLAVASLKECPYCIYFHTEVARFFGATQEELNEAARVGMQTAGWSTFISGTSQDLDAFKREIHTSLDYLRQKKEQKAA